MAYNTKYRIEFDTIKGRSIKVDIEEDGFGGTITELIASSETPLEIDYPNGEFDKMNGIRESKVRIKVLSTNVDTSDFLITSDTQYKVKIYVNNTVEWVGWLDNDYITEEFLDTPVTIELSASDGLSLAKSIDISDLSNNQLWGLYMVKDFIAYALDKTGLGLDFYSFINMFPSGFARTTLDNDAFYYSYITSHTFLRGPREFDDAYTVLSKIMQAFGCTLFQARGAWYIIQTNDRIANDLDGNRRNASGVYQENHLNQNFSIDIGLDKVTKLINADALTSWEREFKETIIKYSFKMPPIFFRNWDLIDGTFSSPLSGNITRFKKEDGNIVSYTLQRQVYTLTNWVQSSNAPSVYPITYEPYTGVEIDTNTNAELVRYLMFYSGTENFLSGFKGITTTQYPVNKDDIFSLSFATREKNTGFKNNMQGIFVRITKANGDYYFLEPNGRWRFQNQGGFSNIGVTWERAEDRRFWKEYNIESDPIPENGLLSIMFSNFGHSRTADNEVHFKDLSVDIVTYFNEMLEVDGYQYRNSQVTELKNLYDNEIFVSKSDNIGTQGAILTDSYAQVNSWKYAGANDNTAVPFAKYMGRAYWRAMYRNFQKMEGRLYDLYQGSRLLSLLNTVQFSAITSKEFMITTLNIDVRNEAAEFTMVELRSTANNNDFTETGTEDFKYLNVKARNFDDVIKEPRTPIDWKYGTAGIVASLLRRNKRRRFNNYS
jgi:hypothetical protein